MQERVVASAGETRQRIRDFIVENYLFCDANRGFTDADSLIKTGIIDSTGILELMEFTESTFNITIDEAETIPENLDSVDNIVRFIQKKTQASVNAS